MRVAVCVPTGDEVKTDFWLSFSYLLTATPGVTIDLLNVRTSLIQNSRFIVVKRALERAADRVLFVDSDMVFPPDALARLLAHDRPIVGATYARRREPYGVHGTAVEPIEPGATGLRRMARMPLGLALIDARVFDRVPRPWFFTPFQPDTDEFVSEDYGFCDAALAVGYDVWCDLDLSRELGHVGTMTYTWARTSSE